LYATLDDYLSYDPDDTESTMDDHDEIQALREKCKELSAELSAVKALHTDEAVCATFLDSSAGRTLVSRMAALQALETAVRESLAVPHDQRLSVEELVLRLLTSQKA